MASYYEPPRPGALTVVAVLSLLWSGGTVIWLLIAGVFWLALGTASWFFGPVAGAAGTLAAMVIIMLLIVRSLLSVVLFLAAWHTFLGDPNGRSLHRFWAWCSIVLDALSLILTWGLSPMAWWGLIYACIVLYVMGLPEVNAYFNRRSLYPPSKPEGLYEDRV